MRWKRMAVFLTLPWHTVKMVILFQGDDIEENGRKLHLMKIRQHIPSKNLVSLPWFKIRR